MSTPFERDILTHHWVSPAPFPREAAPLYAQLVEVFIKRGLLRRLPEPNSYGCMVDGQTEAMLVYQAALMAVPYPVQEWRIPT
jgi:hypothetical protein